LSSKEVTDQGPAAEQQQQQRHRHHKHTSKQVGICMCVCVCVCVCVCGEGANPPCFVMRLFSISFQQLSGRLCSFGSCRHLRGGRGPHVEGPGRVM
jgi:signal transduction protein with GAF and PtsI domain